MTDAKEMAPHPTKSEGAKSKAARPNSTGIIHQRSGKVKHNAQELLQAVADEDMAGVLGELDSTLVAVVEAVVRYAPGNTPLMAETCLELHLRLMTEIANTALDVHCIAQEAIEDGLGDCPVGGLTNLANTLACLHDLADTVRQGIRTAEDEDQGDDTMRSLHMKTVALEEEGVRLRRELIEAKVKIQDLEGGE